MNLEGKVVLITGASEGIGAACASVLRGRGARLSLVARSEDKLRRVAGDDALAIPFDLTTTEGRTLAIERTVAHYGRLDVLINNAGAGLYVPAHSASTEQARQLFELNFFAPFELARLAAPHLKGRGGAIVNVSSIAGKVTLPWFTLYSASKMALLSLTEGLGMELRRDGIHCMSVCPGYVRTQFQHNVLAGSVPEALGSLKQRWSITPEECAQALVRGLERRATTVVTPWSGWLFIAAERVFPSLVHRQLEKIYTGQVHPS